MRNSCEEDRTRGFVRHPRKRLSKLTPLSLASGPQEKGKKKNPDGLSQIVCLPAEAATHTHTNSARSALCFNLGAQHQPFFKPPTDFDKNRHSQSSTHASYTEARCAADAGPLVGFCSKAGNFPHCILAHVSCHSSGRHGDELSFLACCAVVHTCCRGRGAVTADAAAAAAPHQNHSKSTKKKNNPQKRWCNDWLALQISVGCSSKHLQHLTGNIRNWLPSLRINQKS